MITPCSLSRMNFSGNIFNFTLGVMLIIALVAFSLLEERKKGAQRRHKA